MMFQSCVTIFPVSDLLAFRAVTAVQILRGNGRHSDRKYSPEAYLGANHCIN